MQVLTPAMQVLTPATSMGEWGQSVDLLIGRQSKEIPVYRIGDVLHIGKATSNKQHFYNNNPVLSPDGRGVRP